MTLTAQNGSDEVMNYTREAIPEGVKEGSIVVRSVMEEGIEKHLE